ncbi:MAG: gliding motility-associated C-terminal domain-containing protein [Bacteroidota bacterium]
MIKYLYIVSLACIAFSKTQAQDLSVTLHKKEVACELAEASITIVTAPPPVHYVWSNGSITSKIEQLADGVYSVTVTDDHNNDTTISFNIYNPICEPIPATAFTPNDDGIYDRWSIGRLENFPEFDLFVYNRWGQQVHHQTGNYIPWDGRSLGLPLPDATYYYVLYFSRTDMNKFIKGAVSILR